MSRIENLAVGDEIGPLSKEITVPQLFRFSAITWNPHRIHYDREWAQSEGHPDVLVQAHLHGATVQQLLFEWLDGDGQLRELAWQNVGRATPADELRAGAEVTEIDTAAGSVSLDVWTVASDQRCADGTARVEFVD